MTQQTYDVVIAGGGVAGHATAWELATRDLDVLVVDRQLPGRATSASAGGLWPVGEAVGLGCGVIYQAARTDSDGADAVPESLPDVFRDFLVESNSRFPDLAIQLEDITGIDIELDSGPGLLFLMQTARQQAVVDSIARGLPDAWSQRFGGPRFGSRRVATRGWPSQQSAPGAGPLGAARVARR